MVIRAKYHWLLLYLVVFYSALALVIMKFKANQSMVPFYAALAPLCLLLWLTTYTELDSGILTKRVLLLIYRKLPVNTIERIQPHKKNGKWGYGTVVVIFAQSGEKLTLQPNHPRQFLASLRQQAPQATCLL